MEKCLWCDGKVDEASRHAIDGLCTKCRQAWHLLHDARKCVRYGQHEKAIELAKKAIDWLEGRDGQS